MHRTVSPDPLQQSSDLAGYGCVRSSSNVQARCGESDRCSRHAWTERGVGQPESLVQCSRKRRRCHRRTVAGVTITRECLHPAQTLASPTQKSRSVVRSFGRVTDLLYTASCWCRARFSRASWRWPPQRNGTSRRRWSRRVIIEQGSSPDQTRQLNHLPAGRSFVEERGASRPGDAAARRAGSNTIAPGSTRQKNTPPSLATPSPHP